MPSFDVVSELDPHEVTKKVRVTGKQRDDLQAAIALLRKAQIGLPLQFVNFRD